MRRALREHLRDVIAIVALTVAGLATALIILANQNTAFPSWFPILGEERFELKAEFSSGQSITPGQGQAVDIAGIQVGDVTGVELEDGRALVTMEVDQDYAPLIHDDANLLLRPKTGLNDMVVEVQPGTGGEVEEGATLPLAQTEPNVNPDEILATLDADTRSFLKLLLAGGAEGLGGKRGLEFSAALRRLEPTVRDIARINSGLAKRRRNVARAIHNFRLLSDELADKDTTLTAFVDSSNAVLASFARQEASIRSALRELPPTLRATRGALTETNDLALEMEPALRRLLPGARALAPALRALRPFFRRTAGPIRDQIRPFTRQVRGPITHLRQASQGLGGSVPPSKVALRRLNQLFNALAYNPPGSQEGLLWWLAYLNRNAVASFPTEDANGPIQRAWLLLDCNTRTQAKAAVDFEVANAGVSFIETLLETVGLPEIDEVC
jgi:phospholipid/cholesterol/gamma-HCH transport system substrate-binding protein